MSITIRSTSPYHQQSPTPVAAASAMPTTTNSLETKQASVMRTAVGILTQQTTAHDQYPIQVYAESQALLYKFEVDIQLLTLNIPLLQGWALQINRHIARLETLFPPKDIENIQVKWQEAFISCVSEIVEEKKEEKLADAFTKYRNKINEIKINLAPLIVAARNNQKVCADLIFLAEMIKFGSLILQKTTKQSFDFLMCEPVMTSPKITQERICQIGITAATTELIYTSNMKQSGKEIFIRKLKGVCLEYVQFINNCLDKHNHNEIMRPFAHVEVLLNNFDKEKKAEPYGIHIKKEICTILHALNKELSVMNVEKDKQKLQAFTIHAIFIKQVITIIDSFLLLFHKDSFVPINHIQKRLNENIHHLKHLRKLDVENLIEMPKHPANNIESQKKQKAQLDQALEITTSEIRTLLKAFFEEVRLLFKQTSPLVLADINNRYLKLLDDLLVQRNLLLNKITGIFYTLSIEKRRKFQPKYQTYTKLLCLSLVSHRLIFKFNELLLDSQACAQLNYNKENIERICEPLWKLILVKDPEATFDCSITPETIVSANATSAQIEESEASTSVSTSSALEPEALEAFPTAALTTAANISASESKRFMQPWRPIYIPSFGSTVQAQENDDNKCVVETKAPKKIRPKKEVSLKTKIIKMRKRELLNILEEHGLKLSTKRKGKGSHRALVQEVLDAKGNPVEKYMAPFPKGSGAEIFDPGTVKSISIKAGLINRD